MVENVKKISVHPLEGPQPLAAARLCNFGTGQSVVLSDHQAWIKGELNSAIQASPNPWIDVLAYASHKGTAAGYDNQALSERRRDAVKRVITGVTTKAKFIQQIAFGDAKSGGSANNDDGYWRSVEVYLYGALPNKRKEDPKPPPPPQPADESIDWFVTNLSLDGGSIIELVGAGVYWGNITFWRQGKDLGGEEYTGAIGIAGLGAGVSLGLPFLKNNTLLQKALKFMLNNGGGSLNWLPSGTIGIVYPNRSRKKQLSKIDFSGICVSYFLNGGGGILGTSVYVLWFGIRTKLDVLKGLLTNDILDSANGVAIISAGGLGISASLAASINAFGGEIT